MRSVTVIVALIAGAVLAAAVDSTGPSAQTQGAAESTPELAVPARIPDEAKARPNPVPGNEDAVRRGRWVFSQYCATCHAENGDGTGELAGKLKIGVPDFTDPQQLAARTDGELFYMISHGHGHMPAENVIAEVRRWEMVHAMRTMARERGR